MTSTPTTNPAERVRERMRRWMELTRLPQMEVARELGKTQPWLDKILQGKNYVRLRDLDQIAAAMRTTASELVRDESEHYTLELTPTELRFVEQLRRRPELVEAIATLMRAMRPPSRVPDSSAGPSTPIFSKPRSARR